tara:strand:- start:375 stop:686 length:312 start_codon:yes stop_codon:yes gene_type:complete
MRFSPLLALAMALTPAVGLNAATLERECEVRPFTDENIVAIIERERSIRNDLVEPFDEQEIRQFRDGCFYIYQEWSLPKTPGMSNTFVLDQYGVIVDVTAGGH